MTLATRTYRTIFSIHEIEENSVLQWICGASLFFFFITFASWVGDSNLTIESAEAGKSVCWPYIPDCGSLYFLHDPSSDYSQSTFYMALYALMLAGAWSMWRKSWHLTHAIILVLFIWKAFVVFALSYTHADPYHYYHLILTALLLFVPHKEFFLKIGFILLYFMSVTTKLNSTWILGAYFTSLKAGLPLLPDALTALFTNLVILMQMIGSWFWCHVIDSSSEPHSFSFWPSICIRESSLCIRTRAYRSRASLFFSVPCIDTPQSRSGRKPLPVGPSSDSSFCFRQPALSYRAIAVSPSNTTALACLCLMQITSVRSTSIRITVRICLISRREKAVRAGNSSVRRNTPSVPSAAQPCAMYGMNRPYRGIDATLMSGGRN